MMGFGQSWALRPQDSYRAKAQPARHAEPACSGSFRGRDRYNSTFNRPLNATGSSPRRLLYWQGREWQPGNNLARPDGWTGRGRSVGANAWGQTCSPSSESSACPARRRLRKLRTTLPLLELPCFRILRMAGGCSLASGCLIVRMKRLLNEIAAGWIGQRPGVHQRDARSHGGQCLSPR